MLTELILGNFVHFKERQVLRFKKGLNILLGPNHTGKTTVFEAVRRCMSVSKNSGLSTSHDTDRIAYATCKYERNGCTIYSSVITVEAFDRVVSLKAVKRSSGTREEKAVDILGHFKHALVNKELKADSFDFDSLICDDDKEFEKRVIEYLENVVGKDEVEDFYTHPPSNRSDTTCEKILMSTIDEEAVIIFPFRSFSPYQWTKSKRDMTNRYGEIADEIGLKKEVVFWYLKQEKEISEETRKLEKKYFDYITGNSGFEFELVEEKRVGVHNVHFVAKTPSTENLLKIPEGIYEAKSAAIILAVEQFRTICLDDAERGMHPQMIERLRDLVLQDIDDKVVLVITHHPAFLAPWNISRTFFFQRRKDCGSYKFAVKPLADQVKGKGPQIITSGQFSSLFFAERICWVEGKTEYLFFTALKYVFVRKNSQLLEEYCKKGEDQQKRFRDFLSTLHIVSLDGEANKVFFRKISLDLGLDHFFILDFDALHKNLPGGEDKPPLQPSGKLDFQKIMTKFCDAFDVEIVGDDTIDTAEKTVCTLYQHGIFAWRLTNERNISTGAIEDAMNKMCEKRENDLRKYLNDRNITLKMKRKKQVEKGFEKLFKDKSITNDNITEVVSRILDLARNDKASDFYRLMDFLMNRCDEECYNDVEKSERKLSEAGSREQPPAATGSLSVAKRARHK